MYKNIDRKIIILAKGLAQQINLLKKHAKIILHNRKIPIGRQMNKRQYFYICGDGVMLMIG
jgi:hypothetical protein